MEGGRKVKGGREVGRKGEAGGRKKGGGRGSEGKGPRWTERIRVQEVLYVMCSRTF